MPTLPSAKLARGERFDKEREKLRRVATQRGLGGLANDTKWDELINWFRAPNNYVPQYRCKCIDSDFISQWDAEWYWHLPYPLSSVEWMDITFLQETRTDKCLPPTITDNSGEICAALAKIGFEFQKGCTMIRIFGYAPKSYQRFDE